MDQIIKTAHKELSYKWVEINPVSPFKKNEILKNLSR